MSYKEYLGKSFNCRCGKKHIISTKDIIIKGGAIDGIANIMDEWKLPLNLMIVSDTNTYKAAAELIAINLRDAGYNIREHVFDAKNLRHPDENSVGELMFAMEPEPEMIVAVGSGTINDLCRFCSKRTKIPYMIVATAPSMDGYASSVSPITKDGVKKTYDGVSPEIIVGDLYVLRHSPIQMQAAGFGDIVGKIPARLDWLMSNIVQGESMCEIVEETVNEAVVKCMKLSRSLAQGGVQAVNGLMEALILSGIAMQMNGDSRPASGAEHHIAHFLEMCNHDRVIPGSFHGANVGITSLITMRMYEKLFSKAPPYSRNVQNEYDYENMVKLAYKENAKSIIADIDRFFYDDQTRDIHRQKVEANWDIMQRQTMILPMLREKTIKVLKECKGPVHPIELGYNRRMMYDAIKYARLIRPRYTILTYLDNMGLLHKYTEEILDELY